MEPAKAEKRTHDYVRNRTTTLFTALEIATGTVQTASSAKSSWRFSLTSTTATPTRICI